MNKYDISIVSTIYNKEDFIASTCKSIFRQAQKDLSIEYVFVDDASTDKSVKILKDLTKNMNNVKIIQNNENKGPSIRTNQAIQNADGEYIHFIDADDIMPLNCSKTLYKILKQEKADVIYGNFCKTKQHIDEILKHDLAAEKITYNSSDKPLEYVLNGRFIRMAMMIKKATLLKSGGCDESVFIQDESIPLKASIYAKKIIKLDNNVVYVPPLTENNLSKNLPQQHHDKFMVYYNFLKNNPEKASIYRRQLKQKMVSSYWKLVKNNNKHAIFSFGFLQYLLSKIFEPSDRLIANLYRKFQKLPNIRKAN